MIRCRREDGKRGIDDRLLQANGINNASYNKPYTTHRRYFGAIGLIRSPIYVHLSIGTASLVDHLLTRVGLLRYLAMTKLFVASVIADHLIIKQHRHRQPLSVFTTSP